MSRSWLSAAVWAAAGAVVFGLAAVDARAGTHSTLASFQQNVRADVLLEPFDGAAQNFFEPYAVSGGGYQYAVQGGGGVRRNAYGMGSLLDDFPTEFAFPGAGGRPVTAFAGTFRVLNDALVSIGGTVNITLSTGEVFMVTVPVGGTFFGITTTQPLTAVHIDSPLHAPPGSNATFEWIDDVYVGTSGTAAAAADQCGDAPILTLNDATVFPFTTVGATAQAIGNVCDGATDTGPDVWYRFVATSSGLLTVGTCGADFDTILRVFGSCLIAGSGQHLACNDDFCTGGGFMRASRVQLRVDAGSDYLIRISGWGGASGSGNLTLALVADCAGDANHSGGLEVQDIFDFLNAWLGGCP